MTIDDELILELIKPDRYGKIGKDAPIIRIVGSGDIEYKLEEPYGFYRDKDAVIKKEQTYISPDIVVSGSFGAIAIELENDVQWDFMESLRQIKNYKHKFGKTKVIIPKEYGRFAPLYKNEGFDAYLWQAKRIWQCKKCENITLKEGPIEPKCEKCKKRTDHRLIGLKDTKIEEYT